MYQSTDRCRRIGPVLVACLVPVLLCLPHPAAAVTGYGDSPTFSLDTYGALPIESGDSPIDGRGDLPLANYLAPCYPNPFNPTVSIRYGLSEPSAVSITIFDLTGQAVRRLQDGVGRPAGRYESIWNGNDDAGRPLASGVYLYRLEAGPYRAIRRMTLVR